MKKTATISIFLFATSLFAQNATDNGQFPEDDKVYGKHDRDPTVYENNLSIYHTNAVALTFDDGPHPTRTPLILDILKEHNVKATFFLLTEKLKDTNSTAIVKRMIDEGHTIASHGNAHLNVNKESAEAYREDLRSSILKIQEVLRANNSNMKEVFFRFPYGDYGRRPDYHHMNIMKEVSAELFGENCINFAFWSIDTADWLKGMTGKEIAQTIVANVKGGQAYGFGRSATGFIKTKSKVTNPRGGGIVLMHDIHAQSVEGLKIFLNRAEIEGIEIRDLTSIDGFNFDDKQCQLKPEFVTK